MPPLGLLGLPTPGEIVGGALQFLGLGDTQARPGRGEPGDGGPPAPPIPPPNVDDPAHKDPDSDSDPDPSPSDTDDDDNESTSDSEESSTEADTETATATEEEEDNTSAPAEAITTSSKSSTASSPSASATARTTASSAAVTIDSSSQSPIPSSTSNSLPSVSASSSASPISAATTRAPSSGTVIAAILGALAALVILLLLIVCVYRSRARSRRAERRKRQRLADYIPWPRVPTPTPPAQPEPAETRAVRNSDPLSWTSLSGAFAHSVSFTDSVDDSDSASGRTTSPPLPALVLRSNSGSASESTVRTGTYRDTYMASDVSRPVTSYAYVLPADANMGMASARMVDLPPLPQPALVQHNAHISDVPRPVSYASAYAYPGRTPSLSSEGRDSDLSSNARVSFHPGRMVMTDAQRAELVSESRTSTNELEAQVRDWPSSQNGLSTRTNSNSSLSG
ncbi:hypothetical protein MKEN_00935000 [Mycena kentingensis (nom. inval.)]|nr:hypothetical protein MKEN_00935000 [Mycena kentingensis (nom. inval.)]